MTNDTLDTHDELLPPPKAARVLGVATSTLAKWRWQRNAGPPFRRHGARILYSRHDLKKWSDDRTVR